MARLPLRHAALPDSNYRLQTITRPTLVQRYVSAKLEIPAAFLFRENRMHGADGRTADGQTV